MDRKDDSLVNVYTHMYELYQNNSPDLQFGAPPVIDSGEAKIRTASWENIAPNFQKKSEILKISDNNPTC